MKLSYNDENEIIDQYNIFKDTLVQIKDNSKFKNIKLDEYEIIVLSNLNRAKDYKDIDFEMWYNIEDVLNNVITKLNN